MNLSNYYFCSKGDHWVRLALFRLLTELSSRKFVAKIVGRFAKSKASRFLIPKFAKAYHIEVALAEKEITQYQSLNDFFTRRLKKDARPIDTNESSLVSPVDARIMGMGKVEADRLYNIKGQDYSIKELLHDNPRMIKYQNGFYYILYLSPTDYHRIHSPVTGRIVEKEHVAGKVYPVHEKSLLHISKVLSRNERLTTFIEHTYGEIAVVKVGAMNVSSIQYVDLHSDELVRGEELAYFEFGSTVVLVMEEGTFTPDDSLKVGDMVLMGSSLGILHSKA